MKTIKKKVVLLASILMLLLMVIPLGIVSAGAEEAEPYVSIERFNLTFENNIYIKYAVKLDGVTESDIDNFQVLIWEAPQASYEKGSEKAVLSTLGKQEIDDVIYDIFAYTELEAKQMTDDVYARAYVEIDGKVYYSDVKKYSILQYAYNKLGITGTASEDESFKTMLREMLQYGATAQKYFGYKTDRLANADFIQVMLNGGLLPDGTASGLYITGDELTATAYEKNAEGVAFTGWQNASGDIISTELSANVTVGKRNTIYTACYGAPVIAAPDEYLAFTLLEDGTYSITLKDQDKLPKDLEIPSSYNEKTVTCIEANAFQSCTELRSVVIPNSITTIGSGAFVGCSNIESISVPFIGSSKDGETDMYFGYLFSSSNNNSSIPSSLRKVYITGGIRIGDNAFSNCKWITSIILPDTIKTIGKNAFSSCQSLKNFVIPSGVQSIGESAFYYCYSLTDIVIPDSVISVGKRALDRCELAKSISIGSGVSEISEGMFNGCKSLISIDIPEGVKSIGKNAFSDCYALENVNIGSNVQSIGASAFLGCSKLADVVLPDDLTSIGDNAFLNCKALTSINIPNGVAVIPAGAFAYCNELASINIPNGVTSIGGSAFRDCYVLPRLTVPSSVTRIGSYAFDGCATALEVADGVYYIDTWAVDCDRTVTDVTLRQGTVGIADNTFGDLENLVLQDGVKCIGYDFSGDIENMTVPNTVINIQENALLYSGISTIYYTGTLGEWITVTHGHESFGDVTLYYNTKTTPTEDEYFTFTLLDDGTYSVEAKDAGNMPADLIIPSTYNDKAVTQIPDEGFRDCTGVITLIIPDSIEYIGNAAFAGCSNIINITIPYVGSSIAPADDMVFGYLFSSSSNSESYKFVPSTVKNVVVTGGERIGNHAFENCTNLTSISIPDSVTSIGASAFACCSQLTGFVIPDGVTSIGSYAFYYCYDIESINIPDGITDISDYAFYSCSLTSIDLPDGVKSIGDYAFYGCDFDSIDIPNEVKSIGNSAFSNCIGLININIPDSVESIGDGAFSYCDGLTSIHIGNGVRSIGDSAFYFCLKVTSIDIPDNVQTIGKGAFEDCRALVHITIGSGVTSIGSGRVSVGGAAFTGCSGIIQIENGVYYVDKWAVDCDPSVTEVVLRADTVGIADEAFSGCQELISIEIPETVTNIGESAFSGCYKLTDITLPDAITVISDSVFSNCTSLVSINIPEDVTYIGNSAFYNCRELTSIDIPDVVTYIGVHAFNGCQKLTFIVIPDGVEEIGTYMFRGCTALTSIVIGRGVNYIEYYAFSYSGLTTVYYMGTPEEWAAIDMPWQPVSDDNVFYYSENPPTVSIYDYWNYDVNGEIRVYYPKHPDEITVS